MASRTCRYPRLFSLAEPPIIKVISYFWNRTKSPTRLSNDVMTVLTSKLKVTRGAGWGRLTTLNVCILKRGLPVPLMPTSLINRSMFGQHIIFVLVMRNTIMAG